VLNFGRIFIFHKVLLFEIHRVVFFQFNTNALKMPNWSLFPARHPEKIALKEKEH